MDREVALEALSALCNANVTKKQRSQVDACGAGFYGGAAQQQQLSINNFIPTVLDADETSQVSRSIFAHIQTTLQGGEPAGGFSHMHLHGATLDKPRWKNLIIDEDEFFDPQFDCDFRGLKDTETYRRGGEVYERPHGWYRFALKVLDKYDENTWLGTRFRSTETAPGEWPVSYHGTSKEGAEGIIRGFYEPGPGQLYGRGIYSTPYIAEAVGYTKTFTFTKTGKTDKTYQVVLQNRINPKYRVKHYNDKYWLIPIPAQTLPTEEQKMVEKAIRPYGLLIREVKQSK